MMQQFRTKKEKKTIVFWFVIYTSYSNFFLFRILLFLLKNKLKFDSFDEKSL